nr:MAG TPA: repressor domain protein [Caudoviricetes sp.]
MSEIKVFENSEFGKVRVSFVNGEPMFAGVDVATILGYKNPQESIRGHVDEDDRTYCQLSDFQGVRETLPPHMKAAKLLVISESGVFSLIMRSNLPKAKQFKRWVTTEVLPSIRKHGAYMTPETIEKTLTSPDFIIQLATQLKNEQEKRKQAEAKIEADKPKVLFSEAVEASKKSIIIRELAKIITQNGYQIGEKQLYERLRKAGYLCSVGESRNQPSQAYMNMGLFEIKKRIVMDGSESKVYNTTVVTPKGVRYFISKFLGKK